MKKMAIGFVFILVLSGINILIVDDDVKADIKKDSSDNHSGAFEGYNVLSLDNSHPILIDMDGNILHEWHNIFACVKMLPGGTAVGSGKAREKYIYGREYPEVIQEDWNGTIVWNFSNWDDDGTGIMMARQHHDLQRESNPVGYYAPNQDFVDHGKTLILAHRNEYNLKISRYEFLDDVIYEVDWNGTLTGFEWHVSDHIDEMGFNIRSRIGLYFFPGGNILYLVLLNISDVFCFLRDSLFHINSIAYLGDNHWYDDGDERFNPENIIISSRSTNFIAIINRETGQTVWEVGPYYSLRTREGRKLGPIVGQHDVHMIPKGLPGEGNILLFDNGGQAGYGMLGIPNRFRTYSRVIEFNPVTLDIVWEYSHRWSTKFNSSGEKHKFFSPYLSGAQRLPNGNTLITEGNNNRVFEVNKNKEIVWDYVYKYWIYRAYRIPPEWVPGNPCGYKPWEYLNN